MKYRIVKVERGVSTFFFPQYKKYLTWKNFKGKSDDTSFRTLRYATDYLDEEILFRSLKEHVTVIPYSG